MPTPTKGPRLGGGPAHERLILANLATSLFEHDSITTTEAKAKRLRPLAERLVTFAKRGDLHARRRVMTVIRDKGVVHRLFVEIGPDMAERNGGYTRIVRIGHRLGDAGETAYLELIKSAEQKEQERSARIAAAEAKALAQSGEKAAKKKKQDADVEAEEAAGEDRPKRGRKKEAAGAGAGGGGGKRQRTGPRKVGGG